MARNWAICIGVSKYKFHRSLKYAHADAQELGQLLGEKAKFEKVYIFSEDSPSIDDLNPEFPSSPERSIILEWLGKRFPTGSPRKRIRPPLSLSDNLWFFFSGHGWEYGGQHYLLLSDTSTNPAFLADTAISVERIREHLRRYSGAGNIIMLIDACRESGEKSLATSFDKQQGVITIASCESTKFSYEIDELKHGSFTYALLESLQQLGENNCATVERLCRRLRSRVREINRQYGKPLQIPYTVIEPESKYHLFLLPDYIKPTDNDIARLREEAYKAEAEGDYKTAEIMWEDLVSFNRDEALKALRRIWQKTLPPQTLIPQHEPETEEALTGTKSKSNVVSDSTSVQPQPRVISRSSFLKWLAWASLAFIAVMTGSIIVKRDNSQDSDIKPEDNQTFSFETVKVNNRGEITSRETKTASYFSQDLGDGINLDMVYIPGGSFMMGTEDEEIERLVKKFNSDWFRRESPQHQVTLKPFYMSKYPITQGQWKAVCEADLSEIAQRTDLKVKEDLNPEPSDFKENPQSFSFPNTRGKLDLPEYGDNPSYLDRPVEQINWYQAKEFCARLSKLTGQDYRLPSEAQWEYACRAEPLDPPKSPLERGTSDPPKSPLERGTFTPFSPSSQGGARRGFPFYFGETITSDLANYNGNYTYADEQKGIYRSETTPVGMFPPNAFGLYDMHGNLWEWCEDDWHENYKGAPNDGSAWKSPNGNLSIIRGGSFDDNPNDCRSAYRNYRLARDDFDHYCGFRVVCVLPRTS